MPPKLTLVPCHILKGKGVCLCVVNFKAAGTNLSRGGQLTPLPDEINPNPNP